MWVLQLCSSFLRLLWLLRVPCNAIWLLLGTALEFVDSFVILTTLGLSTHDMKPISLYLGLPKILSAVFRSFQVQVSVTYLIKFIAVLYSFWCNCKRNCFLKFLFELLVGGVYKNNWFQCVVPYFATLLNLLSVVGCVCVCSLGFYV